MALSLRNEPFSIFRSGFDDLFSDFENSLIGGSMMPRSTAISATPRGTAFARGIVPQFRMDFQETDKNYALSAELPGVKQEDVRIDVDDQNDLLTITAERKDERRDERANYHFQERTYGMVSRSVRLPMDVDKEKVDAKFQDGVLQVIFPKTQEARQGRRQIKIS